MAQKEVWLKKLQEDADIPEIVYQKADQAFAKIRMEQEPSNMVRKKKKSVFGKKKTAIVILAAVLLLSTLTVGATTYFHWNKEYAQELNVSPEMEKKLNDSNTAKEQTQYTEHDGIRIEAVQSVADHNVARIVLKIYGSEEFPFLSRMNFRDIDVRLEDEENFSFSGGFLDSQFIDSQPDDQWPDGVIYEIVLLDDSEKGLLNKEVNLTFSNIIDSYEEKRTLTELPPLLESVWELSIVLDHEDNGKTYEVNQPIQGTNAAVKRFRLSPVSYTLDYDWKYQTETETYTDENGNTGTFEHTISPPELGCIVYEDGSIIENVTYHPTGHFTNKERTMYQITSALPSFIEYEHVKELIFYVESDAENGTEQVHVPIQH